MEKLIALFLILLSCSSSLQIITDSIRDVQEIKSKKQIVSIDSTIVDGKKFYDVHYRN
jgi:hypothetical protein